MSDFVVTPSKVPGEIAIPSSKSQTLRAILFGMLGNGISIVRNPLKSPDTDAMIDACHLLGTTITSFRNRLEIMGNNGHITGAQNVIDAGNSGIVLRFIAAISALSKEHIVITGDHSIRSNRPIQPLLEGLSRLGVSAISTRGNGYAPIVIRGPIQPGKTVLHGEDSQPVSAMIIASAFASGPVEIEVINPGEKPWVGLTLDWLNRLGIPVSHENFSNYRLAGRASYSGFNYTVPGDLSTAAFPIVAALITQSELTLSNIDMTDAQGDKQLIYVLQQMGAVIDIDPIGRKLHVRKGSKPLRGRKIDINDFIDGIAALAIMGCFAEGETHLTNAAIAKTKECDRIQCLTTELSKMGADITPLDDGLIIRKSTLYGATVKSHHDHRLAMALSIAGLVAKGTTRVEDVDCIKKTYPDFQSHLMRIAK